MVDFILLFVSLLFICSIKAQINLNRSNLAKVCNCNIFDSQIILDNKNISTIVENKFIGLTNLTKFELIQDQIHLIPFWTGLMLNDSNFQHKTLDAREG